MFDIRLHVQILLTLKITLVHLFVPPGKKTNRFPNCDYDVKQNSSFQLQISNLKSTSNPHCEKEKND